MRSVASEHAQPLQRLPLQQGTIVSFLCRNQLLGDVGKEEARVCFLTAAGMIFILFSCLCGEMGLHIAHVILKLVPEPPERWATGFHRTASKTVLNPAFGQDKDK